MNHSEKKLFLSDYDDTLAATAIEAIENVNLELGQKFVYEDWITYSWLFDQVLQLTGWEGWRVFELLFGSQIIQQVHLFVNTKDQLLRLQKVGVDTAIVTSRPPEQGELTKSVIARDLTGIVRSEDVYIRDLESDISGAELKLQKILELRPLAYLDDNPATVLYLLEHLPSELLDVVQLINRPWNKSVIELDSRRHQTFADFVVWLDVQHNLDLK